MYNWFALDIEQAVDSVKETVDKDKFEDAKCAFFSGYKSEHELTQEMLDIMPLMRRFINLYGYARLIRCTDEKFDNEPEWMINLRKKLSGVIDDLEKSMKR